MTGLPLRVEHLSHVYSANGEFVPALDDVSFTVEAGTAAAVVGPSGSGKSTLLAILAGLQRASAGHAHIGADDVTALTERQLLGLRGRHLSVVVQNPARNLLPYGTAVENLRFAQRRTSSPPSSTRTAATR